MSVDLYFFFFFFFFFQAEDGIRDLTVTGVQTCALPICSGSGSSGGSGSGGGSGTSGGSGSSGATYLYVGVDNTTGAIRGYKVDAHGASLAEVCGSPFILQGASTGVALVSKHFVYGSEML